MTRAEAIAWVEDHFDSGDFFDDLSRRVAIPSTSQEAQFRPALYQYLEEEMSQTLEAMGYTISMHENTEARGGPFLVADLARIYVAVGEHSAALEQLERLLSIPAGHCLSVPALELDPAFAPLRGLPGYRRLVGSPRRRRPKLPEAS